MICVKKLLFLYPKYNLTINYILLFIINVWVIKSTRNLKYYAGPWFSISHIIILLPIPWFILLNTWISFTTRAATTSIVSWDIRWGRILIRFKNPHCLKITYIALISLMKRLKFRGILLIFCQRIVNFMLMLLNRRQIVIYGYIVIFILTCAWFRRLVRIQIKDVVKITRLFFM